MGKATLKKIWPVIFITLAWLIFSSPYFFKRLIPFPSKYLVTFFAPWSSVYGMPVKNNAMPDVITQIYPWKKITIDSWKQGQVPLWNPYSFSGTSHLANYQTAVLSPVNLLFFVLPEIDAWSIMILLQPLLAGFFMYIFLRTLERSQIGSLVGSLAFMFSGFITVWMAYGTLGWAVLWLPLLCAFIVRHFKKRSLWNILILPLFLAWSFFSGHFQISTYVLGAVTTFLLFEIITSKKLAAALEVAIGIIAGLLLAMPQILPSLDAYQNSVRSSLFTQTGGIAFQYLVTIFAPDFFGNPVTRNDWFGYYAEWASYIGVVPLVFALFTLIGKKTRETWFFLGLAVTSLLIATPTPINNLIIKLKIPALSTSYSARMIVLTSFALVVLSAYGFDAWLKSQKKKIILYAVLLLSSLLSLWGIILIAHPLPVDKLLIAKRNIILPTSLAMITIFLMCCGVMKKWNFKVIIPVLFVGLTSFDMLRYGAKWMPFDQREYVYPRLEVTKFLDSKIGPDRVFGNIGNEYTGYFSFPSIEGYDAVYQSRYGEFIQSGSDGKIHIPERSVVKINKYGENSEKLLEFLGVRYLFHKASDGRYGWAYPYWNYPNYQSVYKDKEFEVFENKNTLPRAFLVSAYTLQQEPQKILDAFYNKSFDMRQSVILEEQPSVQPKEGDGTIDILLYKPNTITLKTASSVPKLIFLSDVYDKGWHAMVDNITVPIYRADYDFRAIPINAGSHIVKLWYWPNSFAWGLRLAFLGLGVLIVITIQSWYEHRHH